MNIRQLPWLLVSVLIAGLDYITKRWALTTLRGGNDWTITSFFDFSLVFNPGAAFSLLSAGHAWQSLLLLGMTMVITVVLLAWLCRLPDRQSVMSLGLTSVIGGALGNLYDRLRLGQVVDFIHLHIGQYHWPTFNVADTAICLGVALILLGQRES